MYGGLCGGAFAVAFMLDRMYEHDIRCCGRLFAGTLLDDLVVAEDARADEGMAGDTMEPLPSMVDFNAASWKVRYFP
jgi:hypothetical protein